MAINYKYHFGNRWRTGNFDLNVEIINDETGEKTIENIFRTWNKPERQQDDEWIMDDDEVEREGYSSVVFNAKDWARNDDLALRYSLKLIFKKGKKWLETGEE